MAEEHPRHKEVPTIHLSAGGLPAAVDESEKALCAAFRGTIDDLYVYGRKLVQVAWSDVRVSGGKTELSLRHRQVTALNLLERFSRVARYERWNRNAQKFIPCNPPSELGGFYLARLRWNVPTLLGVVTAPTLRADGSVLERPGYDDASGLLYDPLSVVFPKVPRTPTKADALRALGALREPICEYRFRSPADESVALSGILTAVTRLAMPNVPLHAIDAPTMASGKSNLVDVASVIATGHAASVSGTGEDLREFEKRLASMALAGDPIIAIDNVEEHFRSPLLCQLLTQTMVTVRGFGRLESVTLPSTATMFVTGNNLTIVGDLTRRTLICRIDTKSERPELDEFPFNPVERARESRVRYVIAALTLLRAYIVSGERVSVSPLGSYQEWSRLIREPLVWLGCADPVDVISRGRANDPRLRRLADVISSWANLIGLNHHVFTRDLIAKASERRESDGRGFAFPFFREALLAVAPATNNTDVAPDKLGWWLRHNRERPVMIDHSTRGSITVRIAEGRKTTQGARWYIEEVSDYKATSENLSELPL